ncbi:MAG TPA: cytochrome c nitrite reductase small subunit [Pirellulaceae bacterium]|nr:cytochrome c nitrite reductase small subunit [Pirellulaceae bacterium]
MSRTRLTTFGIVLAAGVGILLGLGSFTFNYAEGTSYLSNNPQACVNCHIMRDQFDGWRKSTHHAVATCNDCHVPHDLVGKYLTKVEHGFRHSWGFTFQDFHEPIRIKDSSLSIVEHNCIRCHESLVSELAGHGHFADCARCHAHIGHGARP